MGEPGATREGLMLAETYLMTTRGIPLIYYGDEIALAGAGDPDNRRDFPGGWPGDKHNAFTGEGRTKEEREVFGLVRIQGMSQPEVAQLLKVSVKTVQRRLNRSVVLLTEKLSDLGPPSGQTPPSATGETNGG